MSLICLFLVGCAFLVGNSQNYIKSEETGEEEGAKVYQGPVRPTDNLKHFRNTGETIPITMDG